ncbi:protein lethal(2)k10201 [Musca vetustissima]|uniref:protein lethal(2)k10201 n=1 Tax=Musca vetustissima TaxID=27455 RepID=UPI002AB6CA49|nr:protein lethal(2)k10201 [Musca vetustissima]
MLKVADIENMLKDIPSGYLKPDHDLFTSTNTAIILPYKKLGAINSADIDKQLEKEPDKGQNNSSEIFCNVLNCKMVFDNVASYTLHYNSMHRFICQECKKSLPTEHLLDLHISEIHDSYFKARLDRGERLFKCYVEECKEMFSNAIERKKHCIEAHKFPANFRFGQVIPPMKHTTKEEVKISSESSNVMEMGEHVAEVASGGSTNDNTIKLFSFGHQREKTFQLKNDSTKGKSGQGKGLDSFSLLKDALDMDVSK